MTKKLSKIFRRHKKKAQKKARFLLKHPLLIPVTVFFTIILGGMFLLVFLGASTQGAKDSHIVNVYVDGQKQTVSTRAKNVGDLIQRLKIDLLKEDIVEPSKETPIFEDETQVNIYRARPVSVIDGDRVLTILSAQRAPRLIAADAGLDLLYEDKLVYNNKVDDSILSTSTNEQFIVKRSVEVQLNVYGLLRKTRTTEDNVAEVLKENNITVNENETVQPSDLGQKITKGMLISVNKPGITTLAITESIRYKTETRSDSTLRSGQTKLERTGQNGEQAIIYEIVKENDVEVSRKKLQTVTTIDPVSEVILRGTKPATLSSNVSVSSDKASLMAAAGISPADYPYVDYIVTKESRWRPGAINSGSGAYGLCQSLPASKMASAGADYISNPVTQLRWCSSYSSRYGGWQGAYNAWIAQGWW